LSAGETEADKAEKKRQKALRKKQNQKKAERQREKEIEEETANAGPSMREVEQHRMSELYLAPKGLEIVDIAADGHCLYRAVAFHLDGDIDFRNVRKCFVILGAALAGIDTRYI
jgi:OTU domain-containing protein 6